MAKQINFYGAYYVQMIKLVVMLIGMTLTWRFQMSWRSALSPTGKDHVHRMHILRQVRSYLGLCQFQI